ncbi:odorant receptor 49a-like [Halyomorpha halys]|uniref:odorant receptor 49a-like n=1 Tax=Halyomorpha halys TaxID=286706 RepID=UPI0006D4D4FB|nr:Odorant receptor 128 [Halyomorpha halys]
MSVPPTRWVRSALEVSGMLAPSEYPKVYSIFSSYSTAATAYCCGASLAYFIIMEGATTEKLQSIQITLTILSGLMKLCNAVLQQNKLNTLLLDFDGLWDEFYEEQLNREIMDKSEKFCRLLFKLYKYFVTVTPITNIVMALIGYLATGADQLILQIYMPFDNKKYYIPTQIVQMMLVISPLLANTTSFLLYLVASEQLTTYMRVLRRKLREEKICNQTIRQHQEVIKLLNNTNELFSWLLYFETTAISVECSCSAYALYKVHIKEGQRENVFIDLINFVFCFFTPYVISYCGSKITTESNLLFREAYNNAWYEHDLKAKKDLRILMLGASKILNLQYGNIVVFGMEHFKSIIQVTFNVFNAIIWLEHADQHH